jgi:hypothetical protein
MSLWSKSKKQASSREQIKIKEVRDNILILPGNHYRLILETSSINFELKSEAEQDVLIDGFQNFLNSLPCTLQIVIRIRELDIDSYIEEISATKTIEKEQVFKNQITYYCEFLKTLVSGNKILSRKFYVVITYHHQEKQQDFPLIKEQLAATQLIVTKGLEKIGMKVTPLNSLEVLNLFYSFYNPQQFKTQPLTAATIQSMLTKNYV